MVAAPLLDALELLLGSQSVALHGPALGIEFERAALLPAAGGGAAAAAAAATNASATAKKREGASSIAVVAASSSNYFGVWMTGRREQRIAWVGIQQRVRGRRITLFGSTTLFVLHSCLE